MMEKHFIQYNIVVSLMKTKSKNDKNPVLTYSVSTGFNVNMVFLRATRYYFLLTNHSIHTIKGTEQNLIKILSTRVLKSCKPALLPGLQTFSIYSHSSLGL